MEILKKIWAKALRKVGISVHDRVFAVQCQSEDFALINQQKRTAIVAEYDERFKHGDLVRLCEFNPNQDGLTGREAHYFIKDIIRPGTKGLFPHHCVLTLE